MRDFRFIVPDARRFDAKIVGGLRRAVSHTITVTTVQARRDHGWKDRSGDTRKGLEPEYSDVEGGASASLKAEGNAARLGEGTEPHRIEARLAKALRFQMAGETVFRRGVNHPGTKPDDYLVRAGDTSEQELDMAVEAALDEAFG